MFFSVIIPVYNVEKYLEESVYSVLNQDEKDLEIILVDDGSTDSSGKICDSFAEKYPESVRVIHKENEGLLLTRRCGIRAAKGDYFVHLDSDDYMLPGVLPAVKAAITEYNADLIIGKVAYGASDGHSTDFYSKLPFDNKQVFEGEDKKKLYRQFLTGGYMTSIIQKIAGRDIVDIDKDYSEFGHVGISEDHLQSLPLLDKCKRAVFLDTPFVYYRANSDSMTRIISFEKSRNGVWSKISVFKEEKKYLSNWITDQKEEGAVCAVHCRALYNYISGMAKASGGSEKKRFYTELSKLRNEEFFNELFKKADKKRLGKICRMFYLMLRLRSYRSILTLCRKTK